MPNKNLFFWILKLLGNVWEKNFTSWKFSYEPLLVIANLSIWRQKILLYDVTKTTQIPLSAPASAGLKYHITFSKFLDVMSVLFLLYQTLCHNFAFLQCNAIFITFSKLLDVMRVFSSYRIRHNFAFLQCNALSITLAKLLLAQWNLRALDFEVQLKKRRPRFANENV